MIRWGNALTIVTKRGTAKQGKNQQYKEVVLIPEIDDCPRELPDFEQYIKERGLYSLGGYDHAPKPYQANVTNGNKRAWWASNSDLSEYWCETNRP